MADGTWEDLARELHRILGLRGGKVNAAKILEEVKKLKSHTAYQADQIRELHETLHLYERDLVWCRFTHGTVGTVFHGNCEGYFSRDSYGTKRVEAAGVDWIVCRDERGRAVFADLSNLSAPERERHVRNWQIEANDDAGDF